MKDRECWHAVVHGVAENQTWLSDWTTVQTHVHWVNDAIQPSHPAYNLYQHLGLFQWVGSSHQLAKVLELQLRHQSFQWIFRTDFLYDWLIWSPCRPKDSQESSPAPQFESINSLVLSLLYGPTPTHICIWTMGKTIALRERQTFEEYKFDEKYQ